MAQPRPLYVLEAVDVRRADETDSTRKITIVKMGFPEIKRKTAEYSPGGGVGGINVVFPQIEPIAPKFELKGYDLDILRRMGFAAGLHDKWTFAGALRDKQTGAVAKCRAVIQGIISTWTPDESAVGELAGCNYEINECVHYEFSIADEEIWYWDFFEGEGRGGGISWFSDVRTALGG